MLIGEIYLPVERLVTYYGADLTGAHLPFNFQLHPRPGTPRTIAQLIEEYEAALPGVRLAELGARQPRPAAHRHAASGAAQARVAAMLLLTLRGTPTMYYGDEIGMHDVPIPPERVQDPFEKNVPGRGWAATRSARRCSGTRATMRASRRRALAAARDRLPERERRRAARRPEVDAHAVPPADRTAPRGARAGGRARSNRSRLHMMCWPTSPRA